MVAPHRATGRNKAPLNAGLSIGGQAPVAMDVAMDYYGAT